MALKSRSLGNAPTLPTAGFDSEGLLFGLTDAQLLNVHGAIESKLGIVTLENLDLGRELVLQFTKLKSLQSDALVDDEANFAHRSQAAMTVSRMLQDLVKCRIALNNAEISKQIDSMVIECMRDAPQAAKDAFFAHYERLQSSLPTLSSLLPKVGLPENDLPELDEHDPS